MYTFLHQAFYYVCLLLVLLNVIFLVTEMDTEYVTLFRLTVALNKCKFFFFLVSIQLLRSVSSLEYHKQLCSSKAANSFIHWQPFSHWQPLNELLAKQRDVYKRQLLRCVGLARTKPQTLLSTAWIHLVTQLPLCFKAVPFVLRPVDVHLF